MSFHPGNPGGATTLTPIPETSQFVAQPQQQQPQPQSPLSPLATSYSPRHDMSSRGSQDISPQFYKVALEAPARFSTNDGARPKRELVEPYPAPIIRTNLEADVEKRAIELMKDFPWAAGIYVPLVDWYQLHEFFDGHDLWVEGAAFCFYVMIRIISKNVQRTNALEEQQRIRQLQQDEINAFALHWVSSHEYAVIRNPGAEDLIILFDEVDKENLVDMTMEEIGFLTFALNHHRNILMQRVEAESRYQLGPAQPFPPFMVGPQSVGQQQGHYLGRNPMLHGFMPQPYGNRRGSVSSAGPRPIVEQRVAHRGSVSGQLYRQIPYNVTDAPRQSISIAQINPTPPREKYHGDSRQRGWSNSSRNERGKPFGRNTFSNNNGGNNNRRYPLHTPRGSPPGNIPVREPVYMFNRESSPRDARPPPPKSTHRIVSDPIPNVPFYSGIPIVNNNDQTGSPSAAEQNSHGLQRTGLASLASPTNPERNVSRSSIIQGPLELSNIPATRQTLSNDSRVMSSLPRLIEGQGPHHESKTMCYTNDFGKDNEGTRTVHVSGVNLEMFLSHGIKNMMQECGTVESIHYLPTPVTQRAFVAFTDSSSVQRAIERWNNKILPLGVKLSVSVPNSVTRVRSGSNTSQSFQRGNYNGERDFEYHPRRMSIRNTANNYQNVPAHSRRSSSSFQHLSSPPSRHPGRGFQDAQLFSTLNEMLQHQSALNRFGQQHGMPLESIENTFNNKKPNTSGSKSHLQQGLPQAGSNLKKENVTPKKGGAPASVSKNGKNKGSKHNTSTRPTPVATPVKSVSAIDLKNAATLALSIEVHNPRNSKSKKDGRISWQQTSKKNKSNAMKVLDSSRSDTSFGTDATLETIASPIESTPMARDTSFSNGPNQKTDLSVDTPKISRSQSAVDVSSAASTKQGSSKAKAKKTHKPREPKPENKTMGDIAMAEHYVAEKLKIPNVKADVPNAKKLEFPNPKKTASPNLRDADLPNLKKADVLPTKKTEISDAKKIGSSSGKEADLPSVKKKDSQTSTASIRSVRNADISSTQPTLDVHTSVSASKSQADKSEGGNSDVTLSSSELIADGSVISGIQSPPLNDHEWPTLAPAKCPTLVKDSKLPPPVMGPLNSLSKEVKKSVKVVPTVAVPRAFETRPQPNDLGTKFWPFVRRCNGKEQL